MSGPAVLRGARAAFVFLTRVPLGGTYTDADWRWAPAFFPLVGIGVGASAAAVWIASASAGAVVASVLAVGAAIWLTGAFHEDGLADTFDALGGAFDRERLFEILKDSRIGTYGTVALVVSIGLRVGCLAALGARAPAALVVTHCFARTPPVWLMGTLPYVTPKHTSRNPLSGAGPAQLLLAAVWPATIAAAAVTHGLFSLSEMLALGAAAIAVATLCGWRFRVRAGGLTGDFLGATEQLCECAFLLVLAL